MIKIDFKKMNEQFCYSPKDEKEFLMDLKSRIDYFVGFCGHNKNLTKEQYYRLDRLKDYLEFVEAV